MKKNLRLLCLGLAAATFTCSFAQEPQNMTDKLQNADMELGPKGWAFDGTDLLGKNTKNVSTQVGFYGMNKGVLEAWHSNVANPLGDSYIMQRLKDLPSGTYVFGAYAAAARQYNSKDICERETVNGEEKHVLVDGVHQYEYWSNRDSIKGVVLFANDATVPVSANNPDLGHKFQWAHSSKFNVAVTLSDTDEKKGYMDLGLRVSSTNANYVVWDNATLYYFGNMSEADALDAMAKIDVENVIAIADTLKDEVMHADTLAALTQVIADAAAANVTAANLEEVTNPIFWTAGLARKSATDYANLKKDIESAKVVAAGEWSEENADYVAYLEEAIAAAEKAYGDKAMNRAELTALRKELNWSAGDVKYDSLLIAQTVLSNFISEARDVEGKVGGYTKMQIASLDELAEELADTMAVYETDAELEFAERTVNPNGLYAYIARVNTAIENVKKNTISAEYTKMPIEFKTLAEGDMKGWIENAEWLDQSKKLVAYTSPMYRFQGKIETFRITVKKNKNGAAHFCLSGLKFWDGDGNLIPLTEENLSTEYDHNTLNPGSEDGGGIPALFDEDHDTYFHSAWQNVPAGYHYLDVVLPNGGYDAFSFQMISRSNSNGWDQSHTFPGEMILSTPMPQRDELEKVVAKAKALNAFSAPEPGFYSADFSYVLDAIAEIEEALVTYPSEDECKAMRTELANIIAQFEAEEDKSVILPTPGKEYRLISGVSGYYNQQSVEKAMTVRGDSALCWENVCADSLGQIFVFEEILQDGEHCIITEEGENEDGTTWSEDYYCYRLKTPAGRYIQVDSVSTSTRVTLKIVDETSDTIRLKSLGAGQWNIIAKGSGYTQLHTGGHSSGAGKNGNIVGWNEGLGSASAWYIREMPELPLSVLVEGNEFKSECIHFDAANTITLTADKDCAFENLAFYDLFGNSIAIDSLVISGNTATITAKTKDYVACAFTLNNADGVNITFDAFQFTSNINLLQAAYDEAVAVNPEEGDEVGMYADLAEYTAAIEAAEAMLAAGASDEEIEAMIERLEKAVDALEMNMPVAGKYYYIYNALAAFEKQKGYKMSLFADVDGDVLAWGHENYVDWNRYWQFEPVAVEVLKEHNMDTTVNAYFIKNVANEMYIAEGNGAMTSNVEGAVPYVITVLGGKELALDGLGQAGKRIHANGHASGAGKGGNIVYWSSGAGTASAWNIVEAQYDVTDIDFTEVENDAKVSAKGTFDLFGRRVVAPTAPGIYIIDGKKKYVK